MVLYNFNSGTQEAEEGESCELEDSLLYKDSIRIDRTTWWDTFQKGRGPGINIAESSVLENIEKQIHKSSTTEQLLELIIITVFVMQKDSFLS